MKPLYEIDQQLERLLMLDTERLVDTETGEILTAEEVDKLQMDRATKIEGCLLFAKNMDAEAEMIKKEIDNQTARMKACKKKADWTKEYVANSLQGEKFSTARVAVTYRKSESVEVTCSADALPQGFYKVAYTPDKVALKQALKAGENIAGVQLVTKSNMQIK